MKKLHTILLFVCTCFGANGQVTQLDLNFNSTGILALNHAGGKDVAVTALARPNGKSLEIGYSYFDNRTPALILTTVSIVQFDLNGHPDPGFGNNGVVVLDQLKTDANAADAVLQADGKLLVTGKYLNSTAGPHHYVARLNEDGSLDSSFGVNGIAGHPDPNLVVWGTCLAIQPDGKIVMAGSKYTFVPPGSGYNELAIIRFNSDGTVDNSFGIGGLAVGNFANSAQAVAVWTDGSIYVGGDQYSWKLARYSPNGFLDNSFGIGGLATEEFGGIDQILVQPSGKIVVSGPKYSQFYGFIDRFNLDGSKDITFENAGIIQNQGWLTGMALSNDGKIVVGAENVIDRKMRIFRYWPDGQLDISYDKEIPLPSTAFFPFSLSLLPSGEIILGGESDDSSYPDFCLMRLTDSLTVDTHYGQGGLAVKNIGTSRATATSLLVDSLDRILVGGGASYLDETTIVNLSVEKGATFLSRVLPSGILDSTFSNRGFQFYNSFFRQPQNWIALQP